MSIKYLKKNFEDLGKFNSDQNPKTDRHASVSIILASNEKDELVNKSDGIKVFFIKRAEREGDIWSGHMAFPGGMFSGEDKDYLATALRETKEEIGLNLSQENLIANLPIYHPRFNTNLNLHPFLFAISQNEIPEEWKLDRKEVDEIHWAPLHLFFRPSSFGMRFYKIRGGEFPLPTFSFNDRHVWGVTYVMLLDFLGNFVQTEMGQKILQELNLSKDQLTFWDYGPYRT